MKLRRLVSGMMALLLICSLPLSAFADTWYLDQGDISVSATESGQTVSQGETSKTDDAPVITQSTETTSNTITIKAEENATANVTIQDVKIVISDDVLTDHSGEAAVTIDVATGAEANVTLDGVNIDVGGTGGYDEPQHEDASGEAAVQITGNGDVTMELDGKNTIQGGYKRAGVEKNAIAATDTDPGSGNGNLTITDESGTDGSLQSTGGEAGAGIGGGAGGSGSDITITGSAEVTATGGRFGSGIGGGNHGSGSNITITGSAEVTAKGGNYGAGIGGGFVGSGSDITIEGSAEVTAQGGWGGSSIGGGYAKSGSDITITGSAEVTAQGGDGGSGIGGGYGGSGSNITIEGIVQVEATGGKCGAGIGGGHRSTGSSNITVSEDAQVKAQGGEAEQRHLDYYGAGAAIGDGGKWVYGSPDDTTGAEVTPNTAELNEGWVATYAPGTTDLDAATPDSLTYKDNNGNLATSDNAVPFAKQEPTCTDDGYRAGFTVNGTEVGGQTLPATGHSFTNYISDGNATCTGDGTKTRKCIWCDLEDTVPDPGTMKEHSFTNYISDNNATYDKDGTKTAKCDHCDATDTISDPGSRLVREETVQNAAPYRVVGQDGKALAFEKQQKGGVLTITVDADFATLTGSFSGLKTLKAQGIDTVVFVTNGATSTFALADLLAQGGSTDTYALTHDGKTVTFTLGSADIGKILK